MGLSLQRNDGSGLTAADRARQRLTPSSASLRPYG